MKSNMLNNDQGFCLWLHSAKSGKVRKIRLTPLKLIATVGSLSFFLGIFIFFAGNYGRMQLSRFANYLHLKKINWEMEGLAKEKTDLIGQLEALKNVNAQALDYQKKIEDRLQALDTVLDSASALGVVQKKSQNQAKNSKNAGVGGAELDCEGSNSVACSRLPDADVSLGALTHHDSSVHNNRLLETIEHYIALLKRIPLIHPGSKEVNSGFGYRISPFSKKRSMHEGVDLDMDRGSSVFATADGVVKATGKNSAYGLMVDIDHGQGVVTRYAHLSKILVTKGQKIERNQIIALVGSTGRSTGPHLHYEVRVKGTPRNPMKFVTLGEELQKKLKDI